MPPSENENAWVSAVLADGPSLAPCLVVPGRLHVAAAVSAHDPNFFSA